MHFMAKFFCPAQQEAFGATLMETLCHLTYIIHFPLALSCRLHGNLLETEPVKYAWLWLAHSFSSHLFYNS